MTREEALQNTFICTRLPGGYARLSYETCVMRQSQAVFIRPDLESRYFQCYDCPQGRENIRIYEEKTGMKMGKCSNCGRALYVTEGKVPLCNFCGKTAKAGKEAGVDRETALEAARGLVKFLRPGRHEPIRYPWDEVKKGDSVVEETGIEPNIPAEAGIEPNIPEESPIASEPYDTAAISDGIDKMEIRFEGTDRDKRIREWLMAVSSIARRDPEQQILIILEEKMQECEGI